MTQAPYRTGPDADLVDRIGEASGGYAIEDGDGAIYIPIVMMDERGKGNCSRFLDSLPTNRTIKFPNVISAQLRGALERRGYREIHEWAVEFEDWVPVWVRRAAA